MNNPSSSTNSRPNTHSDVNVGRRTLRLAATALNQAAELLDGSFSQAVDLMLETKGKVVVTGVGKSAHIAAKIVATLNSTGTQAMFMHAGEALHGDVGAVETGDVVVCLSKSGHSDEVVALLPALRQRDCPIIAMTAQPSSPLGQASRVVLSLPASEEACQFDLAPTTSTSIQLALGDALAMALMERRGFRPDDFAKNHPAGAIGKKLTWTLGELTDVNRRPSVPWNASVSEILQSMSEGRYGATVVWDHSEVNKIAGIITDGDLRRALENGKVNDARAHEVASLTPKTLDASTLASKAAQWMQSQRISQVIVLHEGEYVGMVHLHDCLREGLV